MTTGFTTSKSKKIFLLFLLLTTTLSTCTKDFHYFRKAKFNIKSEHEKCSIRVNGTYKTNLSLADSNSIDVDAHVSTTGPYFISTDTVNGIYFTAFGMLTDTGDYTFHLTGHGIPETGELTHLTLLSDQSICGVAIPVLFYIDTINTWQFYDNEVYHHGYVTRALLTHEYVWNNVTIEGRESTNSQARFRLVISYNDPLELSALTVTDSITHHISFVDGQTKFSTSESTLIIDSYNKRTRVLKGRFSWTGQNDEGIMHEVKEGYFHAELEEFFF